MLFLAFVLPKLVEAKLGDDIGSIIEKLGEYDVETVTPSGYQYRWDLKEGEIVINASTDSTASSVQIIDYSLKNKQEIEELIKLAKEWLPKEKFLLIDWGLIESRELFDILSRDKSTFIYYKWHGESKKSQFLIYIRDYKGKLN